MVNVAISSSEVGDTLRRPWIGAAFQNVNAEIAQSLGLDRPRGALVTSVVKDGPADVAGILPGDIIVSINEKRVEHINALGYRLTTVGIGNLAKLELLSRGETKAAELTLMAAPETIPANETALPRLIAQDSRRWIFVVERQGREFVMDRNGNFFRQYTR